MPKRGAPRETAQVVIAREQGRTQRTIARWNGLRYVAPSVVAGVTAIWGVQSEGIDFDPILATLLAVLVPAGIAKILWDGRQKRLLRGRVTELEAANLSLEVAKGVLEVQMTEARRGTG